MLPRPYYDADGVRIYLGDAKELLPEIRADVVVTDPPYGIRDAPINSTNAPGGLRVGVSRKNGKRRVGRVSDWHPPSEWDREIDPDWIRLACASAPIVAWFGQWRKRLEVEAAATHPIRAEIVWYKDTHVGPPSPLAPRDERIWIFSAAGITPSRFEVSVWEEPIIPTYARREHKNEKPLRLMTRLVSWISKPGDTILDPFAGSGPTLRAAKDLGLQAIGIEREERYCEVAANRLAQRVLF